MLKKIFSFYKKYIFIATYCVLINGMNDFVQKPTLNRSNSGSNSSIKSENIFVNNSEPVSPTLSQHSVTSLSSPLLSKPLIKANKKELKKSLSQLSLGNDNKDIENKNDSNNKTIIEKIEAAISMLTSYDASGSNENDIIQKLNTLKEEFNKKTDGINISEEFQTIISSYNNKIDFDESDSPTPSIQSLPSDNGDFQNLTEDQNSGPSFRPISRASSTQSFHQKSNSYSDNNKDKITAIYSLISELDSRYGQQEENFSQFNEIFKSEFMNHTSKIRSIIQENQENNKTFLLEFLMKILKNTEKIIDNIDANQKTNKNFMPSILEELNQMRSSLNDFPSDSETQQRNHNLRSDDSPKNFFVPLNKSNPIKKKKESSSPTQTISELSDESIPIKHLENSQDNKLSAENNQLLKKIVEQFNDFIQLQKEKIRTPSSDKKDSDKKREGDASNCNDRSSQSSFPNNNESLDAELNSANNTESLTTMTHGITSLINAVKPLNDIPSQINGITKKIDLLQEHIDPKFLEQVKQLKELLDEVQKNDTTKDTLNKEIKDLQEALNQLNKDKNNNTDTINAISQKISTLTSQINSLPTKHDLKQYQSQLEIIQNDIQKMLTDKEQDNKQTQQNDKERLEQLRKLETELAALNNQITSLVQSINEINALKTEIKKITTLNATVNQIQNDIQGINDKLTRSETNQDTVLAELKTFKESLLEALKDKKTDKESNTKLIEKIAGIETQISNLPTKNDLKQYQLQLEIIQIDIQKMLTDKEQDNKQTQQNDKERLEQLRKLETELAALNNQIRPFVQSINEINALKTEIKKITTLNAIVNQIQNDIQGINNKLTRSETNQDTVLAELKTFKESLLEALKDKKTDKESIDRLIEKLDSLESQISLIPASVKAELQKYQSQLQQIIDDMKKNKDQDNKEQDNKQTQQQNDKERLEKLNQLQTNLDKLNNQITPLVELTKKMNNSNATEKIITTNTTVHKIEKSIESIINQLKNDNKTDTESNTILCAKITGIETQISNLPTKNDLLTYQEKLQGQNQKYTDLEKIMTELQALKALFKSKDLIKKIKTEEISNLEKVCAFILLHQYKIIISTIGVTLFYIYYYYKKYHTKNLLEMSINQLCQKIEDLENKLLASNNVKTLMELPKEGRTIAQQIVAAPLNFSNQCTRCHQVSCKHCDEKINFGWLKWLIKLTFSL